MAYSEALAERVRGVIDAEHSEMKMFGGLAFMVNTHLAVGLGGDGLLLRVAQEEYDAALARGAEVMRMGERVMAGMVYVPGDLVATDERLREWVGPGVASALARPPKPPKRPKQPRPSKRPRPEAPPG